MRKVKISETELESSSFCLGGVPLGSTLNELDSFRLMDLFVENGGKMIDTAQVYANWLPIEPSISEKVIGKWMKSRKNRNGMIVTTKGAHPRLETMHVPRLSDSEIRMDLEASLKRLQVETIDLYWLHRDDPTRPVGAILETLNEQVRNGKVRYLGCSNWSMQRIKEAQEYAQNHHIQGFSGNQMMWSLAAVDSTRWGDPTLVTMDDDMKQYHSISGLTAIPYSPQAKGLFTKLDKGDVSFSDESIRPMYRCPENQKRLERVRKLAEDLSLSVNQVVLGYLISHAFPTIPVIGCHSLEQLLESLRAEDVHFTPEQIAYLERGV